MTKEDFEGFLAKGEKLPIQTEGRKFKPGRRKVVSKNKAENKNVKEIQDEPEGTEKPRKKRKREDAAPTDPPKKKRTAAPKTSIATTTTQTTTEAQVVLKCAAVEGLAGIEKHQARLRSIVEQTSAFNDESNALLKRLQDSIEKTAKASIELEGSAGKGEKRTSRKN